MMWLRDYGFDGLRFDAVHALKDESTPHFLAELAHTVRGQLAGRHVHLMLENEANQSHLLERPGGPRHTLRRAMGDDFHNALHVLLTVESEGYYEAFADKQLEHLARSRTEGFAYQGEVFPLHNQPRGQPSKHLPPDATIFFAQNHDQVGNRALGERLTKLVSDEKLRKRPLKRRFSSLPIGRGIAATLTREGRRGIRPLQGVLVAGAAQGDSRPLR